MDNRTPASYSRQSQYPRSPPLNEHESSRPPPLLSIHQHQYYPFTSGAPRQNYGEIPRSSNMSPTTYHPRDTRYASHRPHSQSSTRMVAASTHEAAESYKAQRISPTASHVSNQSMSTKRAYRQRRKDPSCDACRERKVKCDATDTSSCSECLTRTVKCQFTKETNRRMSSIKQVQDLQTQLKEAMHRVGQLQRENQILKSIEGSSQPKQSRFAGTDYRSDVERASLPRKAFEHVRKDIRIYSRGLFEEPPMYRVLPPAPMMTTTEIKLPDKHTVDTLLSQFHDFFHLHRPFMQWQKFMLEVEKVYELESLKGMTQIWVGTFFVMLACGSLQSTSKEDEGLDPDCGGIQYMIIGSKLLNTWTDNFSLDHARISLMISIFLNEQNIRSASWIWLGSGVRILQDVGLHLSHGPWSRGEDEERRLMFWSLFSYDRLSTLDGRPLQVYDDIRHDRELLLPTSSSEDRTGAHNRSDITTTATMTLTMPVIDCISAIKQLLKAPKLSPETLRTYDAHFQSIITSYPDHLQISNDAPLDPFWLHSITPLLSARIILFRHNLGPHCSSPERHEAMNHCLRAAFSTVGYLKRCLDWEPGVPKVPRKDIQFALHQRIRSQSDYFLCKHLWRTTLILAFRGEYEQALVCVRFMSIIGDMRKVNMASGRNLSWFLSQLLLRTRDGTHSIHSLDLNEELIAYASGDVQGDPENSWIWTSGDDRQSSPQQSSPSPLPDAADQITPAVTAVNTTISGSSPFDQEERSPFIALVTQREMNDWGGWERVENLLHELMQEQERQRTSSHVYQQQSHGSSKRVQVSSTHGVTRLARGPTSASSSPTPSASASRMSIANII